MSGIDFTFNGKLMKLASMWIEISNRFKPHLCIALIACQQNVYLECHFNIAKCLLMFILSNGFIGELICQSVAVLQH